VTGDIEVTVAHELWRIYLQGMADTRPDGSDDEEGERPL
jgi:hypothetical protein